MKFAGRAGFAESAGDLFHFSDKSPGFRRVGLNALFDLARQSGIIVFPLFEESFPDAERFGRGDDRGEKGNGAFRVCGVTHL